MFGFLTFLAALGLAAVHVFSHKLRVLQAIPRNALLSAGSGIAVAFVILRLLPAVAQGQQTLEQAAPAWLGFVNQHVYAVVLLSIVVYYALERVARNSKARQRERNNGDVTEHTVFWLHVGTFALMNLLIGYLLLHNEERQGHSLLFFWIAMTVKFIVNDHGLHQLHKEQYDRVGRWILVAAVLLGWGVRYFAQLPEYTHVILQAFIAGGVLLNVLKEELPEERKAKYWAFALAALVYGAFLVSF